MIHYLKITCALVLVLCLFLPIASCQYQVPDQANAGQTLEQTDYYYVLLNAKGEEASKAMRYLPVVLFITPLFLAVLAWRKKTHSGVNHSIGLLVALAILTYLALYRYFTQWEMAAYLASCAAFLYALASCVGLYCVIKQRKKRADSSA